MLPNINKLLAGLDEDWRTFLPELLVCGLIVLLLLLRIFQPEGEAPAVRKLRRRVAAAGPGGAPWHLRLSLWINGGLDRYFLGLVALALTLFCVAIAWFQWAGWFGFVSPEKGITPNPDASFNPLAIKMYGGLLVYDRLTIFLRMFLLSFAALVIWLSLLTGIPDREDGADFYVLLLGATLGMLIMASANHLMMLFIGIEMASLPSYALAGFLKGRRQSSEAALKYVVYGGGAAGVMLYGISLLAGKYGTGYLPDLAVAFAASAGDLVQQGKALDPILVLGTLFVVIGIAFKLAAVPFHFWCPDVFEGASAEVAGFLSVASKAAAVALLARVVLLLGGLDPWVAAAPALDWMAVKRGLVPGLAALAVLTATFGNLAAYTQTNLKRLLAYSTIAHAGYMLMGLAALTQLGVEAVLFYLVAYLFMNLGAFAVVAFIRNLTGTEDLSGMRGLVRRAPWLVITLAFFLLSLLGIPPLVGFVGKFRIFQALFLAGKDYTAAGEAGLGATMYGLLLLGGINTVFSAVYYIKVLKVMTIDEQVEDVEGKEAKPLPEPVPSVAYASLLALATLLLGVIVGPVAGLSHTGAERYAAATSGQTIPPPPPVVGVGVGARP
jgi:NADH-quinone oxidoreductase subunit N